LGNKTHKKGKVARTSLINIKLIDNFFISNRIAIKDVILENAEEICVTPGEGNILPVSL